MSNKLIDLNEILFDQLRTLKESKPDDLKRELSRSDSMCQIAAQIIQTHRTAVTVCRFELDVKGESNNALDKFLPESPIIIESDLKRCADHVNALDEISTEAEIAAELNWTEIKTATALTKLLEEDRIRIYRYDNDKTTYFGSHELIDAIIHGK